MTAISPDEWEQQMDAGATTYTVGSREPTEVYLDRAAAEAAASRPGTTLVRWDGHAGQQIRAGHRQVPEIRAGQAAAEPESEAGQ